MLGAVVVLGVVQLVLLVVVIASVRRRGGPQSGVQVLQAIAAVERDVAHLGTRLEQALRDELGRNRDEMNSGARQNREELSASVRTIGETVAGRLMEFGTVQVAQFESFDTRIVAFAETIKADIERLRTAVDAKLEAAARASREVGESLRVSVETRLTAIQSDNSEKLEQMRATVEEKLQSTLERRLSESFALVSERLNQVHEGLGEMKQLASGVGDLKKVLTNIKTRGTWGEVQLGALLEQMLTREQYAENVAVNPNTNDRVEFAIKLPGRESDGQVWLAIDSKFPQEDYQRLIEASERGDSVDVAGYSDALEQTIVNEAKKIRDKYICPPHTTDFAILFVPTEALFAELLRRPGMCDRMLALRVVLAGPTTLAALLTSLQMGFRTLAIEKRSSEVWTILGSVKTEFRKFGDALGQVEKKLEEASKKIGEVHTRTRVLQRKLKDVEDGEPEQAVLLEMPPLVLAGPEEEE